MNVGGDRRRRGFDDDEDEDNPDYGSRKKRHSRRPDRTKGFDPDAEFQEPVFQDAGAGNRPRENVSRPHGGRISDTPGDRGFQSPAPAGNRPEPGSGSTGHRGEGGSQSAVTGPRRSGTLKFFNTDRGFGFIAPDDGAKDIFVHITALERSGLGPVAEGARLSFQTEESPRGKGPQAINIQEDAE